MYRLDKYLFTVNARACPGGPFVAYGGGWGDTDTGKVAGIVKQQYLGVDEWASNVGNSNETMWHVPGNAVKVRTNREGMRKMKQRTRVDISAVDASEDPGGGLVQGMGCGGVCIGETNPTTNNSREKRKTPGQKGRFQRHVKCHRCRRGLFDRGACRASLSSSETSISAKCLNSSEAIATPVS